MEKINYENDTKKTLKISQNENQEFLSQRNNNNILLNIQNNENSMKSHNNKYISYVFDHTRFKKSRLFGINFYHIGNLYVFGFMGNNSDPLFSIDKQWYFHLIIYSIEYLIYYFGNKYLYSNIEPWKQISFNILLILFFFIYTALITLNPGIILKSEKVNEKNMDTIYCRKCQIQCIMERDTQHCYDCDVCVRKLDHHCSVVRRCITRKNLCLFIGMVVGFILIYIFSLINLVIYFIGTYRRIKK